MFGAAYEDHRLDIKFHVVKIAHSEDEDVRVVHLFESVRTLRS